MGCQSQETETAGISHEVFVIQGAASRLLGHCHLCGDSTSGLMSFPSSNKMEGLNWAVFPSRLGTSTTLVAGD